MTYGKSKISIDGAEAAPIEIFVGNTHPRATSEKISEVMKQCANELPDKTDLEILDVKCLTNLDLIPNPRTKCWKLTVPYRFKELMSQDELYPAGWSHRPLYPPRQNRAKRQKDEAETGAESAAMEGA